MKLEDAVRIYRREFAAGSKGELDRFRRLPTLSAAVRAATMAIGPNDKMLAHQRRVGHKVLTKATRTLLARLTEIDECQSFDELHALVTSATRSITRFGPLTRYDTALRIGAKKGLMPEVVYLH